MARSDNILGRVMTPDTPAEAAAQADYTARIHAALIPTPHPTPADGGTGAK